LGVFVIELLLSDGEFQNPAQHGERENKKIEGNSASLQAVATT